MTTERKTTGLPTALAAGIALSREIESAVALGTLMHNPPQPETVRGWCRANRMQHPVFQYRLGNAIRAFLSAQESGASEDNCIEASTQDWGGHHHLFIGAGEGENLRWYYEGKYCEADGTLEKDPDDRSGWKITSFDYFFDSND